MMNKLLLSPLHYWSIVGVVFPTSLSFLLWIVFGDFFKNPIFEIMANTMFLNSFFAYSLIISFFIIGSFWVGIQYITKMSCSYESSMKWEKEEQKKFMGKVVQYHILFKVFLFIVIFIVSIDVDFRPLLYIFRLISEGLSFFLNYSFFEDGEGLGGLSSFFDFIGISFVRFGFLFVEIFFLKILTKKYFFHTL